MRRARPSRVVDTLLLLTPATILLALLSPAARALPAGAAIALAAVGFVGWALWLRQGAGGERPERERWMLGVALGLAGLALAVAAGRALSDGALAGAVEGPAETVAAYRNYWRELELRAAGAAHDLAADPGSRRSAARAFEVLERGTRPSRLEGLTLMLLAADGEVVAWAGGGLLREPSADGALAAGRFARQSHAAATAWVVRSLATPSADGAVWIVAGESRPLSAPPPLLGTSAGTRSRSWRFGAAPEPAGWTRLAEPDTPELAVGARRGWAADPAPGERPDRSERRERGQRALRPAALAAGIGLLGLAALRALALGVLSGTVLSRRVAYGEVALVGLCALVALAAGLGVGGLLLAALALAGAVAAAATRYGARTGPIAASEGSAHLARLAVLLLPLVAAGLIALLAESAPADWPDLAESPIFDERAGALRLTLAAFLFAALALARRAFRATGSSPWLAAAALLVLAAAATHDRGVVALALTATALVAAARGLAGASFRRPGTAIALALFAMFGSAVAWQWGARSRLARELPELLEALLPPSEALLATAQRRLERQFFAFDLASIAPGADPELDPADLAYALWRESPLARLDAASALTVEPHDGAPSHFAFGYPLDDRLEPDRSPARFEAVAPAAWRALELGGGGAIVAGGREIGRIAWHLVPRPGFGVRDAEIRDLPTTLLGAKRSSELAAARALALPAESGVALLIYGGGGGGGEIELSPWREGTPALAELRGLSVAGESTVETPGGRARFALREARGTTLALAVPRLSAGRAVERTSAQFAGALFPLALALLLAALLALPRRTARDLVRHTLRSYSQRLILVYSLLLLLPLALLYALLSQSLGRRLLDEQRYAAEAALLSAQRILGEYVLSLEPGFGLDTALDDDLLVWLSRVVGYEIHLYWNGQLYASSQPELFAAGFLSRRVPGEVFRGAAYAGERLMTRTTRAGEARYVELYAPLAVPGIDPRAARLLLSMPLLAQQQEAIAETARIRRGTLLATLGAFLLLGALGLRLARSFTRPITDLVAGTRRIAAGAPALDVSPGVNELSALAEAIDQMARRIAEGREQLVREKQLVERIVDSVTSAVVGVDRSGRVLLANRVARQMLDVEPGERLLERLALRAELAELARFVASAGRGEASATARAVLSTREDRDWSLVWVPLAGSEEAGGLLVVEDVSEVLRAQRLDAWAAMARLIAHEIKNPLTPIRLSAEHLRDVWQRDRAHFETVFERCTANILKQVDALREIASEFSVYSHIPKSERVTGDLVATVREVVEGYVAAPPDGTDVRFEPGATSIAARFDPKLIARAVRNLVENAIRATTESGAPGTAGPSGNRGDARAERREVRVEIGDDDGARTVWIRVSDDGAGVPADQLARIFEPYFSTHAGGTGLGLPIALRIAEEHGGAVRARNRATGGLEVTITMPRE